MIVVPSVTLCLNNIEQQNIYNIEQQNFISTLKSL